MTPSDIEDHNRVIHLDIKKNKQKHIFLEISKEGEVARFSPISYNLGRKKRFKPYLISHPNLNLQNHFIRMEFPEFLE